MKRSDLLLGFARLGRAGPLALLFVRELVVSAVKVALLVLHPDMNRRLQPGIVAYPLTVLSDGEITVLANLITLTPGTLSLDVSDDRRTLYIHALNVTDRERLIGDIAGGFETRVLRVFR